MRWSLKKKNLKLTARKSLLRSKKFLFLILVIFLAIFFWLINSNIFKVKILEVKKDGINCTEDNQIKDESRIEGSNIFTVDDKKIEEHLKFKFICIKRVFVSRSLPNKVSLEVSGRRAVVILVNLREKEATAASLLDEIIATPSSQAIEDGDKFLVDDEGVVFSKIDSLGDIAPRLYFSKEEIILGEAVKGEVLRNSLFILEKTKNLGLSLSKVRISEDKFLIVESKPRIVFDLSDPVDVQLASLQLILQKAKMESNDLEFIDLRFDKPIVKVAPKKNG